MRMDVRCSHCVRSCHTPTRFMARLHVFAAGDADVQYMRAVGCHRVAQTFVKCGQHAHECSCPQICHAVPGTVVLSPPIRSIARLHIGIADCTASKIGCGTCDRGMAVGRHRVAQPLDRAEFVQRGLPSRRGDLLLAVLVCRPHEHLEVNDHVARRLDLLAWRTIVMAYILMA